MQNHLVGVASEERKLAKLHGFAKQIMGGAPHTYDCIIYRCYK